MAKDEDKKDESEKDESKAEAEESKAADEKQAAGDEAEDPKAAGNGNGSRSHSDDEDASDEEEDEDEEEEAPKVAAKAKAESSPPRAAALRPAAAGAHAGSHAHAHDDHGFAHLVSIQLLGAVLTTLLVLTYITYAVTKVDLGGQWNLVVAMVIATIKAGLVVTFFMHMLWDKKFNLLVFLSSVLFLILFLSLALTDRKEYQHLIDQREAAQALQK